MALAGSVDPLIRRATERDVPTILECLCLAFDRYRQEYTPEGFADTTLTRETIRARMAAMTILVAVGVSGEILGTIAFALVNAREGHLRGMAVRPEWQGKGIAERLLAAAEAEMRSRNCRRITLDTTAPLQRAIRFYEKHGYRPSGAVGDFFGMPLFEYEKLL
jgi:GNAT superfamily N-acetyltransferase